MAKKKGNQGFTNPLSGEFWGELSEDLLNWYFTELDVLVKALLADGYAPFTSPLTPERRYQTLLALRNANHPTFTNSLAAQKELAKLAKQLGDWPPPAPPSSGPIAPGLGEGGFQPFHRPSYE